MIHQLTSKATLKESVVYNQNIRLKDFQHGAIKAQFIKYIKAFIGEGK